MKKHHTYNVDMTQNVKYYCQKASILISENHLSHTVEVVKPECRLVYFLAGGNVLLITTPIREAIWTFDNW